MKNSKHNIFICISIAALLFVSASKADAQNLELGLRYNPEFTGLMNKNDYNAGNELGVTSHFGYLSFGAGGESYGP
jgi:hypothetical protein